MVMRFQTMLLSISIQIIKFWEMLEEEAKLIDQHDYCDEAELMIQEYSRFQAVEFQEQLDFINAWVNDSGQTSMLITGAPVSGIKMLLYQYLKECKQIHPNWLFIYHFASITPVYSNILYKIMTTLRNHFNIEQKVDLNQEKLRRYFKYWLEVTSDFLQKQYLGYNREEIPKVVIVIEGINKCIDPKGNPVEPQFWLPSLMPPNIKLILTTKESQNINMNNLLVLRHQFTRQKKEKVVSKYCEKVLQWSKNCHERELYTFYVANQMLKRKQGFRLEGSQLLQLLNAYISHVASSDLSEDIIKSLLYTLILARKGLKSKQICKIVNISIDQWQYFLRLFSFFIVETQRYFAICNRSASETLRKIVDPRGQKSKMYRNSIVKAIKKESIHLRSLQEVVYQLLLNESHTELKEVICRIENFLTLYTPFCKELLCQCWSRLEQLQQFDPVFEYNKAIQAYKSHYYPKEEDLYKIIFQISMFFKEYAEFQNSKTPSFRHPFIKGETEHLETIGIFDQINALGMVGKCKVYKLKPLEKISVTRKKKEDRIGKRKEVKEQNTKGEPDRHVQNNVKHPAVSGNQLVVRNSSVKSRKSVKRNPKAHEQERSEVSTPSNQDNNRESDIIEEAKGVNIEQINVGIIANQQKFKNHFFVKLKEYLEKFIVPFKKNIHKEKLLVFESDESDNDEESCVQRGGDKQFRVDIEKIKGSLILKGFKEYLEESYHKNGQEVQYYYYKQWIWLQFPWLCQTVKHVYSAMLKECIPGSIHFMNPTKEFSLIKDVLKIAKSAKQNKLGIYTEKKIQIHCIKPPSNIYGSLIKAEETVRDKNCYFKMTAQKSSRKVNQNQVFEDYKINLKNIDEQLYKQKTEETKFRDRGYKEKRKLRGDNSLPNLNLFVTEATEKESRMFPVLKRSNFAVETIFRKKKEKENHQDSRDYTTVIRKYNELKHENDMLVQKIEEAKRLQMQKVDKSKEDIEQLNQKIQQLEEKKRNLQKSHKNQIELRKKLEVIIKICDLNKMYGSETDYLSSYLDNLKKMIELEEGKIGVIKDKIYSQIDVAKNALRELKTKKKELKALKQQTLGPYSPFNTEANRLGTQFGLQEIEQQLKDISRLTRQKSVKKPTKLREKRAFAPQDFDSLENEFGILYGQSGNEEKIKQFSQKQERLKMLRLQNADLSIQLKNISCQLQALRNHSKNQLQGDARELELKTAKLLAEKRQQLSQIRNRNCLLINAKNSLQNADI